MRTTIQPRASRIQRSTFSPRTRVGSSRRIEPGGGRGRATASAGGHRLADIPIFPSAPTLENGPAPIQRNIDASALTGTSLDKNFRKRLAGRIKTFNKLKKPKGRQNTYGRHFESLHGIDREINSLLRDHGHEISTTDRTALFGLLRQSESQHVDLTGRAMQRGDKLWLPNDIAPSDQKHARKLWESIRKGSGNIKVEGKQPFKNQVFSGVSKLLQGSHGRGLLNELNKGKFSKDRGITIRRGDSSEAEAIHKNRREIKPGNIANIGTGSTVNLDFADHPDPGNVDAHESGTHGEPIFAPHFVTLGHELGHARANLKGVGHSSLDDEIGDDSSLWSNAEERRNITQDENALRAEHSLPARKYHRTIGSARHERIRKELDGRLEALWGRVPQQHRDAVRTQLINPGHVLHQINQTDFSVQGARDPIHQTLRTAEQGLDRFLLKRKLTAPFRYVGQKASQLYNATPRAVRWLAGTGLAAGAGYLGGHYLGYF